MYLRNAIKGLVVSFTTVALIILAGGIDASLSQQTSPITISVATAVVDSDATGQGALRFCKLVEEKTKYGPTESDYNHQADALKTHNVYERLHELKNAVLVMAADKDRSCPKIINKKMHELLPKSKLIVLKNAAHQSILEYPQIINQHIIEFLKK